MSQRHWPCFKVLGIRVDAVQIPDVICQMEQWINEKSFGHFIAVTNTHVVTEARRQSSFKRVLGAADLVVPDGMPLVWLGRQLGYPLKRRVYGLKRALRYARVFIGRSSILPVYYILSCPTALYRYER